MIDDDKLAEWEAKNADNLEKRRKQHRDKTPEQRAHRAALQKAWRATNIDKVRAHDRERGQYLHRKAARNRQARERYQLEREASIRAVSKYRKTEHGKKVTRAYTLKRRTIPGVYLRGLASHCFSRCRRLGIPYDVAIRDFIAFNPATNCACCGLRFDYEAKLKGGCAKADSPSIDRIEPSKGYVMGNIAIICFRCNLKKSDGTIEDFERIIKYIRKHSEQEEKYPSTMNMGMMMLTNDIHYS